MDRKEEDNFLSGFQSSKIFTGGYHRVFTWHLKPFNCLLENSTPQHDLQIIGSLAKQFSSFLTRALSILPTLLLDTPEICYSSALELLDIYRLCIDSLDIIAPELGNMRVSLDHRYYYICCLRHWKIYDVAKYECNFVLEKFNISMYETFGYEREDDKGNNCLNITLDGATEEVLDETDGIIDSVEKLDINFTTSNDDFDVNARNFVVEEQKHDDADAMEEETFAAHWTPNSGDKTVLQYDDVMRLDLYIHDYLVRKNLHSVAETFAKEADFCPKNVSINPPDGFLTEWWSIFWDMYTATVYFEQGEIVKQIMRSMGRNVHPNMPMPDMSSIMQNVNPAMRIPGRPNMLQSVNLSLMSRPDIGSLIQNPSTSSMPRLEQNPNRLGPASVLDSSSRQGQGMTNYLETIMREQELHRIQARDFNLKSQLLNVDRLASMMPFSSTPRRVHETFIINSQPPVNRNDNSGIILRRPALLPAVPKPRETKALVIKTEPADTGVERVGDQVSSDEDFLFGEFGCIRMRNKVTCCHFSTYVKLLASVGHDKKVVLWNMDTLQIQITLEEHQHVITDICFRVWDPGGTPIISSSPSLTFGRLI